MDLLLLQPKPGFRLRLYLCATVKKSECLYLLNTDTSLNNAEIVRIYGNRWSIECFFKASKSFLKLGSEFQSRTLLLGYKTAERLYALERIEGKQEAVDRLDDVLYHKIPYISQL